MANAGVKCRQVLFVDDEPFVLNGLRRSLRRMSNQWTMVFASSGDEGLSKAKETQFDAVVSDMRMPGMDGADVLTRIADLNPRAVRVVLSGHAEEEALLRLADIAHQYWSKPCDTELLVRGLERAFRLRDLLNDPNMQALIARVHCLPSPPELYVRLSQEVRSECTTVRAIGRLIGEDPPVAAKILQLVNSAFFGLRRHVADPQEAATLLGLDTLKTIILSVGVLSEVSATCGAEDERVLETIAHHGVRTASLARDVMASVSDDRLRIEDSFAAGLLQHLGLLTMVIALPDHWKDVKRAVETNGLDDSLAIDSAAGVDHFALGAYLLGLWGLPDGIVEAVAFHRDIEGAEYGDEFGPKAALHVANRLIRDDRVDPELLSAWGVARKWDQWRELVQVQTKGVLA